MPKANLKPPNLGDPSQFTKLSGIPVFTTHTRQILNKKTNKYIDTEVDSNQLEVLCKNTNSRIKKGEWPLITIGHRDPELPETKQPPLCGYVGENYMGEYNGKPTILSDFYVMNAYKDDFTTYPRRSSEVFKKESPEGYIDSVAVLRRVPALDLGYITHFEGDQNGIESFECDDCETDKGKPMGDADGDNLPDATDGDNDNDGESDVKDPANNDPSKTSDNPEGTDPEGDDKSGAVDALATAIASKVGAHLSTDQEFLQSVGSSAAEFIAQSPQALDALIKRIGEIMESGKNEVNPSADSSANSNASQTKPSGETMATDTKTDNYANTDQAERQADKVKMGLLEVRLEKSEEKCTNLQTLLENFQSEIQALRTENRTAKRVTRLNGIAAEFGIEIDVNEKIEKFANLDDDVFEMFAAEMEENRPRAPIGNKPIRTANNGGKTEPIAETEDTEKFAYELTQEESDSGAVEMFAAEQGIDLFEPEGAVKAVKMYLKNGDRSKFGITKKK